jgi:plastocyanin
VRCRRPTLALLLLCGALLLGAAPAGAVGHRVSIGDYRWSTPEVEIDLGEHVTWHWVGPDTIHSVTGISANDAGLDSDPGTSFPQHNLGDTFRLTFNTPGVYQFQCKLHPTVRGEVVVSSNPGDPNSDPDPIPKIDFDTTPPVIGSLRLARRTFTPRGTGLHFALDETALIDAEIWRPKKPGRPNHHRYAGYIQWHGHTGFDDVLFGHRKHFRARPGRYIAVINATDTSHNTGPIKKIHFTIVPG